MELLSVSCLSSLQVMVPVPLSHRSLQARKHSYKTLGMDMLLYSSLSVETYTQSEGWCQNSNPWPGKSQPLDQLYKVTSPSQLLEVPCTSPSPDKHKFWQLLVPVKKNMTCVHPSCERIQVPRGWPAVYFSGARAFPTVWPTCLSRGLWVYWGFTPSWLMACWDHTN